MLLTFDGNDLFGYYTMLVRVKEPRTILPDRVIGERSTLYSITGERRGMRRAGYYPRHALLRHGLSGIYQIRCGSHCTV